MGSAAQDDEREEVEIQLLLEAIYKIYGFDFRDYAYASIRRRIGNMVSAEKLKSISGLQEKIVHEPACMERFLLALTVNVTSLFRDPTFYEALKSQVVPLLRTYPFIRIWHAGCSTGEEVYSMAILMTEAGLYSKCRIYATDMNGAVLKRAKDGIFSLTAMREYTDNYLKAGGDRSLSEYYTANYEHAIFHQSLKKNVVFAQHNLVSDRSFNEFNLIVCRNVMIYFNQTLQSHVFELLHDSLAPFGILALGSKESIRLNPHKGEYEELASREKIFRRVV